jgi:hypothetical protein
MIGFYRWLVSGNGRGRYPALATYAEHATRISTISGLTVSGSTFIEGTFGYYTATREGARTAIEATNPAMLPAFEKAADQYFAETNNPAYKPPEPEVEPYELPVQSDTKVKLNDERINVDEIYSEYVIGQLNK